MPLELPTRLVECFSLWNSAERAAKAAELITGKAVLASINELRYAGRWMVLVLDAIHNGRDRIDAQTTLEDAVTHVRLCCFQAKHDAIDSIVLYLHSKIELISNTYTIRVISIYVEGYTQFLADVKNITDQIILSREDRLSRVEIYNQILDNHIPRIQEYITRINAAEAAISEEMALEEGREWRDKRNFWISTGLAIFFGVASIILGIPGIPEIIKWLRGH